MSESELLSVFLENTDTGCPGCGYSLRGIRHGRCPECNEELTLRVGLAEPRLGAVIAFLAGAWCCTGMTFAFLVCMVGLSLYFDDWPPFEIWVPGIIGFVVATPFAICMGTRGGRSWLRRRAGWARGLMVAGAWTLFVGCFVGFAVVVAMW